MGLTAKIEAKITATASWDSDMAAPSVPFIKRILISLADGDGADEADEIFADTRVLAASANEELDLAGVLTNIKGETITFARIKAILLYNSSHLQDTPTDADITFESPAANGLAGLFKALGDGLDYAAGAGVLMFDPGATAWPVTAATADLLKVTNNDGSDQARYDIVIIGVKA